MVSVGTKARAQINEIVEFVFFSFVSECQFQVIENVETKFCMRMSDVE